MIKILDPAVVNQIAAGEVVERPAHLVKELIENSIDAGATEIEIDYDQGGRQIRVRDNGSGIAKVDLPLALSRHATSKISLSSDLWELQSFGFRGEALASISAVSRLRLVSKTSKDEMAHSLTAEFGKMGTVESVGGEPGTLVEVQDLFANVPARLKFLKSEAAEGTQIKNVIKALALAHPQIGFRVRHKKQLLFYWPPHKNLKDRVEAVLDTKGLYLSVGQCDEITAEVVMASPQVTSNHRRSIWLFAQNRWVQDAGLQAAVMDAYRNLLMHGEYPIAAVFVKCPPNDIDVNIHPAKSQVKFANPSSAYRAVFRAVRQCMERAPWLEELGLRTPAQSIPLSNSGLSPSSSSAPSEPASHGSPSVNETFSGIEFQQTQYSTKSMGSRRVMDTLKTYAPSSKSLLAQNGSSFIATVTFTEASASLSTPGAASASPSMSTPAATSTATWSTLQVIGQADLTYIVAQSGHAIVFIDQHAAHERVMFEQLMQHWKEKNFEVQTHLLPITVDLEADEIETLLKSKTELRDMGFEVEAMGPECLAVSATPALISESAVIQALKKMAQDRVGQGESFALEKTMAEVFATMACHSAVRAGQALSLEEMTALLQQMDEFSFSSFCPHGRPVFVEYPFSKLERDFGRIV